MKKISLIIFTCLFAGHFSLQAQKIDSVKFFRDETPVEISLTTDIKKLQDKKTVEAYQPAEITLTMPGESPIKEQVKMFARGKSRRENCLIPPIMVNFRNAGSPKLSPLGKLKLVVACGNAEVDEQLVMKEYMIYKIYNLLEEKSFRVRLVHVTYNDSKGKMKPITQYSYIIEDVDDMAERNGCATEGKKMSFQIEETDPALMNKVDLFEYMIANIDWSVPANHNIKCIWPKNDETAKVWPVPYDFDNAGLVNAYYATPNELLGATSVTERIYRGFPRKIELIQANIAVFERQKENILSLVKNFDLLKPKTKSEMTDYINSFYRIIADKNMVQNTFILNARKE